MEFDALVDWLAEREGKSVYIEAGINDPTLPDAHFYPVAVHATLDKLRIGDDIGHHRGLVVVPLRGGESDRLFIDRERVSQIEGDDSALRVWFHDSMYLAFSG